MSGGEGKRATYHLRQWLVDILKEVQDEEGVTEAEAIHALCKHGRYLRNAAREPGIRILIERDGRQTEVVFL